MNDTHGTNKLGYDKIALLGLFILSLLMARLVITFKSGFKFSKPIPLPKLGLSVSMPSGRSWQSDKKWTYQENMFTISSLFPLGSDIPTTWANCRYLLSAETATPQMLFEQTAAEIDAVIVETQQTQTDGITIDWVRIHKPEFLFTVIYGTAGLPDNRQLDIEVRRLRIGDRHRPGLLRRLDTSDYPGRPFSLEERQISRGPPTGHSISERTE